jgi:hypothetical protein
MAPQFTFTEEREDFLDAKASQERVDRWRSIPGRTDRRPSGARGTTTSRKAAVILPSMDRPGGVHPKNCAVAASLPHFSKCVHIMRKV